MEYKNALKALYFSVNKNMNKNTSSRAICLVKIDLFFDVYKEFIYDYLYDDLYYEYYYEIKKIYEDIDKVDNKYKDDYESLCSIWLKHYQMNRGII